MRNLKFPLPLSGDVKVRNIEELICEYEPVSVLERYLDGRLVQWLIARGHMEQVEQLQALDQTDRKELARSIAGVLGVKLTQEQLAEIENHSSDAQTLESETEELVINEEPLLEVEYSIPVAAVNREAYADLVNINRYVMHQEQVYYYDSFEGELVSVDLDGTNKRTISRESVNEFAIVDNVIFALDKEAYQFYAMDLNGKNRRVLQEQADEFTVDDEYIYFCKRGNYSRRFSWGMENFTGSYPWVSKRNSSGATQIPYGDDVGGVAHITAKNGWLYYIYIYDKKIYRIKPNGSSRQCLTPDSGVSGYTFMLRGDWIYFDNNDDHIARVKLNGTGYSVLFAEEIFGFEVTDSHIFYIDKDWYLNRIDLDGTNKQRIASHCGRTVQLSSSTSRLESSRFQVVGEWVYYENKKHGDLIYKVRVDGTDSQAL